MPTTPQSWPAQSSENNLVVDQPKDISVQNRIQHITCKSKSELPNT